MQSCKCTDVADNGIQRVCCRSARSERGDMKTAQQMVDEAAKRDIVPRACNARPYDCKGKICYDFQEL